MTDISNSINFFQKENKKIVQNIKDEFSEISKWLEENNVDLESLGKYIKNLSAIALVSVTILTTAVIAGNETSAETNKSIIKERKVLVMNSDSLPSPTTEEKEAIEIWNKYATEIDESAQKYKVDPRLIFATIMVESRGNPEAYRYEPSINDASYGLGQLLYGTAVLMGYDGEPQQLTDPKTNIDMIARYHRYNLDVYGELNVDQIATAYNAGNPYGTPIYGHVNKFTKWYQIVSALVEINNINYES
jgi:soluble lytic murein transglycosylase-like protein